MAINREKTQMTIMCPHGEGREITIVAGEKTISHQTTLKILGFRFGEDGKMDNHLWKGEDNMIRSIRIKSSIIQVIKPYITPERLANIGGMI